MKITILILNLLITLLFTNSEASSTDSLSSQKSIIQPVRGAWLTNVDSKVLNSKENIKEAVRFCRENGINTLFAVTWNKGMTTYPSRIMGKLTGVEIDTQFTGRDPLRELIDEAHKNNIKVIAWFEFGFCSSYKQDGGKILALKPEWRSADNTGRLVTKNGFDWMNAFHPEVRRFILSLILEVIRNYDVDGIQGDDRLPAMPSEGGYDKYTVGLYKSQHNGKMPPENFRDPEWLQWRANLLNSFMEEIYTVVKEHNPKLIVSMAPSVYPWSVDEYLQDWPTWVNKGYVDIVCPQLYRYKESQYVDALDEIIRKQIDPAKVKKLYPGVLLNVGSYLASEEYLQNVIKENRKRGIEGEVFFFFEGLRKYPGLLPEKLYKVTSKAK